MTYPPPGQPAQQPPYGNYGYPPQGYQQQPGYGQQPPPGYGGFPPGPRKKSKKGLFIGLGAGGLVVVVAAVVLVFVLGGSGADSLADKTIAAISSKDFTTLQGLTCRRQSDPLLDSLRKNTGGITYRAQRTGNTVETGNTASAPMTLTITGTFMGRSINRATLASIDMNKTDGWCIDKLDAPAPLNSESGATTDSIGTYHQVAQQFLDAVNDGDGSAALALACSATSSGVKFSLDPVLGKKEAISHLKLSAKDSATEEAYAFTSNGPDGAQLGSGSLSVKVEGKPCIDSANFG